VISPTTQPCNGEFGSTDSTASRNAMVADAMSRATQGAEPNFSGTPTRDWTTPTPAYKNSNGN